MRKSFIDVQKAVVGLASNKKASGEVELSLPPSDETKSYSCGEPGHFRAQCPRNRFLPDDVEEILEVLWKMLSAKLEGKSLHCSICSIPGAKKTVEA